MTLSVATLCDATKYPYWLSLVVQCATCDLAARTPTAVTRVLPACNFSVPTYLVSIISEFYHNQIDTSAQCAESISNKITKTINETFAEFRTWFV